MTESTGGRGLSAAGAGRVSKRVKREPMIAKAAHYKVIDPQGVEHEGTFKTVHKLCPLVNASTLKRRLDNGERNIKQLRRAPEPKQGVRARRSAQILNFGKKP